MKKDRNTGDLFTGFKSEPEQRPITEEDICQIFNGRVLTKEEVARESRKMMEWRGRSGEKLVKSLCERGVRGDIEPNNERVEWYKKVLAEDEEKRRNKKK